MRLYLILFLVIPFFCLSLESCQKTKIERISQAPNNPAMNLQIGNLFLAKNKLKPGVHALPSGLQFQIIKDGLGVHPKESDLVTLYYQGRYINGEVFDNVHAGGNPVSVRVSSVLPGWKEALQLMSPGSIWVLYIPSNLAYGEKGVPGLVGPNQTLIYSVSLIAIKKS